MSEEVTREEMLTEANRLFPDNNELPLSGTKYSASAMRHAFVSGVLFALAASQSRPAALLREFDGWQLVPKVPTEEMMLRAHDAVFHVWSMRGIKDCYDAMLASANPQALTEEMVAAAREAWRRSWYGNPSADAALMAGLNAAFALTRPAADRGQIVEECARVADEQARREALIFEQAKGDAALNDTGLERIRDRALARELIARAIASAIRTISPAPAQTAQLLAEAREALAVARQWMPDRAIEPQSFAASDIETVESVLAKLKAASGEG